MQIIGVHDKKQSFVLNLIMLNSIISGSMRHCRYQPGLRRVGYIRKILEDGFNGIAGENKNRPCCTGHMMRGNYEG